MLNISTSLDTKSLHGIVQPQENIISCLFCWNICFDRAYTKSNCRTTCPNIHFAPSIHLCSLFLYIFFCYVYVKKVSRPNIVLFLHVFQFNKFFTNCWTAWTNYFYFQSWGSFCPKWRFIVHLWPVSDTFLISLITSAARYPGCHNNAQATFVKITISSLSLGLGWTLFLDDFFFLSLRLLIIIIYLCAFLPYGDKVTSCWLRSSSCISVSGACLDSCP